MVSRGADGGSDGNGPLLRRITARQLNYVAERMDLPGLMCMYCGSMPDYPVVDVFCSRCGAPLTFRTQRKAVPNERMDVWRYADLMPEPPGAPHARISLGEGWTPLLEADSLRGMMDVRSLLVKYEAANPTGSIADRGSAVLISALRATGYEEVIALGDGSFAASIAAYAARAKIRCSVAVTRSATPIAMEQALAYGARVYLYDEWRQAAAEVYRMTSEGRVYLTTPLDPLFFEAEKTAIMEVMEQALELRGAPNIISVPASDGPLVMMALKGLMEFRAAAKGHEGRTRMIVATIDGGAKRMSPEHLRRIREGMEGTGAANFIDVKRSDAIAAMRDLASAEGMLVDIDGAAALAAARIMREEGTIGRDDVVAVLATGSGLGDMDWALKDVKGTRIGAVGGLKLLILEILSNEAIHGYGVWKALKERGVDVTLAAVYTHIAELERMGYVIRLSEEQGGRRRVNFTVTARGLEALRV